MNTIDRPARADEEPERNPPLRVTDLTPVRVLRGGMSLVYICHVSWGEDPQGTAEPRRVAIKRLIPELAYLPGAQQRFLRECYMWLFLGEHPNVVVAQAAHQGFGDTPFIRLECLPGSLRGTLQRSTLDYSRALVLMLQVVDGLLHIRGQLDGFVHADLKPENILVDEHGTAKITDLGLAHLKEFVSAALGGDRSGAAGQSSAAVAGTPLYMSPEQIHGGTLSEKCDLYAIGCLVFEAMTGSPVYGTPTTAEEYLLRHLHAPAPRLTDVLPEVPSDFGELIDSCLRKDPSARPTLKTARDVLLDLAGAAGIGYRQPEGSPVTSGRLANCVQGLLNIGLLDEARTLLERHQPSLRSSPQEPEAYLELVSARASIMAGQPEQAREQLDHVASMIRDGTAVDDTTMLFYYTESGNLAYLEGDAEAFEKWSIKATELAPGISTPWANLAKAQEELGRRSEAIASFERALSIAGQPSYYEALIGLLLMESDVPRVGHWAADFRSFHPDNPLARATYALSLAYLAVNGLVPVNDALLHEMVDDYNFAVRSGAELEVLPDVRQAVELVLRWASEAGGDEPR